MTDRAVNVSRGGEKTSSTLLARARARDPEAWRRVVHLYGPLVYRWCRQFGLREADAADVGQDVFLAVSRSIETYQSDREGNTFRGWLRTITRNKVRDFLKHLPAGAEGPGGSDAQAHLLGLLAEDASGDEDDRALLLHQAVEAHLSSCNDTDREAFLRVMVRGEDPADVARALAVSKNVVYLARSRILRQLRDEYAELLELD